MVNIAQTINRGLDAFHAGLQLEGNIFGIVSGLVQIASVEPHVLLQRGLPHVPQLTLPWAWVLGGVGS